MTTSTNKDRFDEAECRSVIRNLRPYRERLDELINLLDDNHSPSPLHNKRLHDLLGSLKADVKNESHQINTGTGRASLTSAEAAFYLPAISKASAYLPSRSLHPSKWLSNGLSDVHYEITHFLRTLEEWYPDE